MNNALNFMAQLFVLLFEKIFWAKQIKAAKIQFGLQFEGAFQHGGKVMNRSMRKLVILQPLQKVFPTWWENHEQKPERAGFTASTTESRGK